MTAPVADARGDSPRTATACGGDIVADAIRAHGVGTIFTLVGGHVSPILTAAEARGIRVVDVRDEATAAFAADAYARLAGIPGVAVVTAGPGVTNVITALKNAQLAQSPLVLIGGATATILKGRGALQDIDQRALVTPHVKWAAFVTRVRDLSSAMHRAFREARSGVPGPVFVECPVDLLYPEAVVREMFLAGMKAPRSFADRAVQWYLRRHLARVFGGVRPATQTPAPPDATHLSPLSLEPIRRAITTSRRPVIVAGSQVVAAGADAGGVAQALAAMGVPVYLSGMARGLLGANHPLQFRHKRREALREADLVVLCGTPCDFRLDYGRHIAGRATLVSINRSRDEARKNRRPAIVVVAPPDRVLAALAQRMPVQPDRHAWFTMLRSREEARDADVMQRAAAPAGEPATLNPLAVCRAIDRHLPDDAVLVADGGDFVATASYTVRPRSPLSWLDPGVFGTLGVGAGFVLGAHAARPAALIVAIYGDGAFGFSVSEIDTWVKQRVPVVAIIGNDGKWAQIARDQVALLGSAVATTLGRSAYHAVAAGFGALGLLVSSPDQIDDALSHAIVSARSGCPAIVNVQIGDTDFRQGSMSL